MLDAPWPPPHDGPQQPRDAHAGAWADPRTRPAPPPTAAWWTTGPGHAADPPGTVWTPADGGARARRAPGRGADAPVDHRVPSPSGDALRERATWLPAPAWIPQPAPAPEQRWTPEQDWVAAFARRAPAEPEPACGAGRTARWLVAGAVAAVVVPLTLLALALGL